MFFKDKTQKISVLPYSLSNSSLPEEVVFLFYNEFLMLNKSEMIDKRYGIFSLNIDNNLSLSENVIYGIENHLRIDKNNLEDMKFKISKFFLGFRHYFFTVKILNLQDVELKNSKWLTLEDFYIYGDKNYRRVLRDITRDII